MEIIEDPILVTGAAGFIGASLARKLLGYGLKVIGVDNLYISDISVLNKSVPGSTSVASMVLGYRFARIFNDNNIDLMVHSASVASESGIDKFFLTRSSKLVLNEFLSNDFGPLM